MTALSDFESDAMRCRCPEPDPPGWAHFPYQCSPLAPGETIGEWRGRRFEGRQSIPYDLDYWYRKMDEEGFVILGAESVVAEIAELPDAAFNYRWAGHDWDRIILGFEDRRTAR